MYICGIDALNIFKDALLPFLGGPDFFLPLSVFWSPLNGTVAPRTGMASLIFAHKIPVRGGY